jgi:hypothetical protein
MRICWRTPLSPLPRSPAFATWIPRPAALPRFCRNWLQAGEAFCLLIAARLALAVLPIQAVLRSLRLTIEPAGEVQMDKRAAATARAPTAVRDPLSAYSPCRSHYTASTSDTGNRGLGRALERRALEGACLAAKRRCLALRGLLSLPGIGRFSIAEGDPVEVAPADGASLGLLLSGPILAVLLC